MDLRQASVAALPFPDRSFDKVAQSVRVVDEDTMRFGHAMAPGMEQFVDLHVGDASGPTVPIRCGWSSDRTLLTCVPDAPLHPRTTYALHLGGGMMDADGHLVDMGQYGAPMGGHWLYSNMMSGHGGMSWRMMGSGWHNPNGSYGMFFTFTTA